ncbi:MAG: hypothetical protein HZA10_00770 [Nitrospirae bacterium]|nr:hypothetical protein [Nitrospirota bacterium]
MKDENDIFYKATAMAQYLIFPIFTIPFYLHSPKQFQNLRNKEAKKVAASFKRSSGKYYGKNPKELERIVLRAIENKYPSPMYYNDIAGFIAIKIENPIECYRVIAEVWGIKNRRFKSKKIFQNVWTEREFIDKEMLNDPVKFNLEFFEAVKKLINKIKKNYLCPKKFYFSMKDSFLNFDFLKSCNVAGFLNNLGKDWIY